MTLVLIYTSIFRIVIEINQSLECLHVLLFLIENAQQTLEQQHTQKKMVCQFIFNGKTLTETEHSHQNQIQVISDFEEAFQFNQTKLCML